MNVFVYCCSNYPECTSAVTTVATRLNQLTSHLFWNGSDSAVVCAVEALAKLVVGKSLQEIVSDFRGFYRLLTSDGQMRWVRLRSKLSSNYCLDASFEFLSTVIELRLCVLLTVGPWEGSDPPGHCCCTECSVGPMGQSRGQGRSKRLLKIT